MKVVVDPIMAEKNIVRNLFSIYLYIFFCRQQSQTHVQLSVCGLNILKTSITKNVREKNLSSDVSFNLANLDQNYIANTVQTKFIAHCSMPFVYSRKKK